MQSANLQFNRKLLEMHNEVYYFNRSLANVTEKKPD